MRVGIVGAGIAGLRAAQLLERLGVDVTMFEARNRVGGRLWTAQVGDQVFEAGAEWIDAEHARVFALLRELNLEAVPSDPGPRRYFFCGKWIERPEIAVLADEGQSLADALDKAARSPREREYLEAVALSDEGTDSDRLDLAEWRRFAENYSGRVGEGGMSAFRFPVGTSELCARVAGTVRGDLCLNAELKGVRDTVLEFVDGQREEFDEVVLTLPPPCLEVLDYDRDRPWEGVGMTPTCKVALLFDEPFWEGNGHLMTDLAVQQVWPCGRALVCYVNGRGMEALVRGPDPVHTALEALVRVLPAADRHFVTGRLVNWVAEPFSGGGFPYVPVGSVRRPLPTSGHVHFAGDWTVNWMGFVEGALESAERVVQEIKNEHGLP